MATNSYVLVQSCQDSPGTILPFHLDITRLVSVPPARLSFTAFITFVNLKDSISSILARLATVGENISSVACVAQKV